MVCGFPKFSLSLIRSVFCSLSPLPLHKGERTEMRGCFRVHSQRRKPSPSPSPFRGARRPMPTRPVDLLYHSGGGFHVFCPAPAIGGRALCQSVLCSYACAI